MSSSRCFLLDISQPMSVVRQRETHFIAVIMGGGPAYRIMSELKSGHDVPRTTKEYLDIVVSSWEVRRNLLLSHKSDATGPPSWGVIQNIEDLESRGVVVG